LKTSLPCCSRFSSALESMPPRRPPPNAAAGGRSSRSPTIATPFAVFDDCAPFTMSGRSFSLNRLADSIAWIATLASVSLLSRR
jgi:hypothetical protein